MASGGRHGLEQNVLQVGGNNSTAMGPLTAAAVVAWWGQNGVALYALTAAIASVILWKVGTWYKTHGLNRMRTARQAEALPYSRARIITSLGILALLIFSKYLYLVSITTYFTFYLIHTFGVSVQVAQLHLFLFLAAVAVGT